MDRRLNGTYCAKLIKVIETRSLIGEATCSDPPRILYQYFDLNGHLLAEHDPIYNTENLLAEHTSPDNEIG